MHASTRLLFSHGRSPEGKVPWSSAPKDEQKISARVVIQPDAQISRPEQLCHPQPCYEMVLL